MKTRLPFLAASALALVACTPSVVLRTHPPLAPHPARAVAVTTFSLPWDDDPRHPVLLGDRLALRVARGQRYAVFGPSELSLGPTGEIAFPLPTDWAVTRRLPEVAADRASVVVLRGWAEWHLGGGAPSNGGPSPAPNTNPARGQGRGRGAAQAPSPDRAGDQNSYVAHLELFDAEGHLLAEAEADPRTDPNLGPEIDALADRMLLALANLAPGTLVARRPWWDGESVTLSGPRVEGPSPASAAAGLREDDVVIAVGSSPATDLSVARERYLAPVGGTVPVTVRRAGTEVVLQLPATP